MLHNFKWLIAQSKWDAKIDNLNQQQSSNSSLWEQLAESEKRERVLKQELESLQGQVQTQLRVIDRFKDDMQSLTISNKKLNDFFTENEKKLKHLQIKQKDFEMHDEVNIPKIIQAVEQKQRKINELEDCNRHKFVSIDRSIKQIQLKVKR